jgi:hypothetical protein
MTTSQLKLASPVASVFSRGMPTSRVVRLVFWLWFAAAFIAGWQLVLQRLPPLAGPAIVFGLTALLLSAYFRIATLRTWVDALDPRSLVTLHLTRFIGGYFIVLYRRGDLPYEFAVPGGAGDIIVATLALALVVVPLAEGQLNRAIYIWNIVGLVDIMLVVASVIRLNLADPSQLRALTYLPLSLLPTFLVPLIIATHVVLFARLSHTPSPA